MADLKLTIDLRERNVDLISAIEQHGFEIKREVLPVGDYLISDRVCIERKTIWDFESSIISGRLFEQAKRLKEAYAFPIILIEGNQEDFRMSRAVITGAISSIYIDYGIPVMTTSGTDETAEMIKYMAKHEQEQNAREPSVKGGARSFTQKQFMERVVGNMPGIGIETARNLLNHFGNIKSIATAPEEKLVEVENVGKKRAKAIFDLMTTQYPKEEELSENGDDKERA